MSRLNKYSTPIISDQRQNIELQEEGYVPQHPMLQYQIQSEEKTDHLENYVEVNPFEDTENVFGDMFRSAKKKVSKIFKKDKKTEKKTDSPKKQKHEVPKHKRVTASRQIQRVGLGRPPVQASLTLWLQVEMAMTCKWVS